MPMGADILLLGTVGFEWERKLIEYRKLVVLLAVGTTCSLLEEMNNLSPAEQVS